MNAEEAIRLTAHKNGISESVMREEIQRALDEAWNTTDPVKLRR